MLSQHYHLVASINYKDKLCGEQNSYRVIDLLVNSKRKEDKINVKPDTRLDKNICLFNREIHLV